MKCGEGWEASSAASFRRRRWEGDVILRLSLTLSVDVIMLSVLMVVVVFDG